MDDYIAKPVDPKVLADKLEKWIGKGEGGEKGKGSSGKWQEERETTVPPLTLDTENLQARSQEPATSPEQPATSNQEPATSPEQPATSNKEPATSPEQPATNNEQPSTIFNKDTLLERLMGDEETAAYVIAGFVEDIPLQIDTLRELVEQGNAEPAGAQAHKIKGAAANIGGEALGEVALEMEKAGKAGEMEQLQALMAKLEEAYEQLKAAMEGVEKWKG
ncbi:MAG: Hpt domain-containing protein [Desulfohalobiaceae bacterium]|nr:Hpt domain-containing protein [Desulfohalobiaceae bacterium]